jgi:trehalose 6-phosphate synthase/phosphatase
VRSEAAAIRRDAGTRRIVLGVDRLDYTKGLPRRLRAVERLVEMHPEWKDTLRFIQVAVPSRGEVDVYQRFKRDVEEQVGRVNGTRGSLASPLIHYLHRSVSTTELAALYTAADVMLVTPLRDGMNLVAKEFVASRLDSDGVLVLSEFAGAAAELEGAVCVNPYDIDASAEAIHRALTMSAAEQRARMTVLRRRVATYDVHAWARSFIDRLLGLRIQPIGLIHPEPSLTSIIAEARRDRPLRLLLDYDGTLVPLARSPELAAPDQELLTLLDMLVSSPNVHVDLVSGRPRRNIEDWFGHLPIDLWAEHGFWHRDDLGRHWTAAASVTVDWMARLRPLLEQFTDATPGSSLEVKSASVAWHYRRAQREFGSRQAHELRMLLGDTLSNQPLEVLEGSKVIEVRLRGVNKGLVARHVAESALPGALVVAIGDDRTDDDLFGALTPDHVTVAVGQRPTRASYRLNDYRAVRRLLRLLVDDPPKPGLRRDVLLGSAANGGIIVPSPSDAHGSSIG